MGTDGERKGDRWGQPFCLMRGIENRVVFVSAYNQLWRTRRIASADINDRPRVSFGCKKHFCWTIPPDWTRICWVLIDHETYFFYPSCHYGPSSKQNLDDTFCFVRAVAGRCAY